MSKATLSVLILLLAVAFASAPWERATGPGHDNGIVRLLKKSRVAAEATDMNTDQLKISDVRLGLPSGSKGTGGGSYLVDLYDSNR